VAYFLWATLKACSADIRTLRTNFGDRAFSAAGPRVWNYLPMNLRQPGCVTAGLVIQPFLTVAEDIFDHCV